VRFSIFIGVLVLSIAGGLLYLDDSAADFLREAFTDYQLDEVLAFERLELESRESLMVSSATLRDPVSNRVVAHVERVELRLDIPWNDGLEPAIVGIYGRGGRVLLRWEDGDLGLVRAISELVNRLLALPGLKDSDAPLPELIFEDLELVVHSEGFPLERYPGSSVLIEEVNERIEVTVQAGPQAGELLLAFDEHGLARFESRGLRVSPAVTLLDRQGQDLLRNGISPSGYLDLIADVASDGSAEGAAGILRDAYIDTEYVPFRLGPATVPFRVGDRVLTIEEAMLGFDGGEVMLSVEAREHETRLKIDVDGADFRERFLQLIPGYQNFPEVQCSDGGSFECHLDIQIPHDNDDVRVEGGGGFHIERVDVARVGLVLEDVVGRFDVDEWHVLSFPEVSARFFDGRVRAAGALDLTDDTYQLTLSVEDVDAGKLHRSVRQFRHMKHEIAGWLQGEIRRMQGTLGVPGSVVADGQASVRAGNFWPSPVFEAILKALTLDSSDAHQRAEMQFDIRGKQIFVDSLNIESDKLTLAGSGKVYFDGRLDFELVPITVPLGLVGDLLEAVQRGLLVNLVVTGTLRDPRVIVMPVSVVTNPIRILVDYLTGGSDEGG
jgi:hypothetical protein